MDLIVQGLLISPAQLAVSAVSTLVAACALQMHSMQKTARGSVVGPRAAAGCAAPQAWRLQGPCRPRVSAAAGKNGTGRTEGLTDPAIKLVNGAVTEGPDLSVVVNGMKLPNPFVIGSGPPGTNYQVMKKAFDEGWGGVICKTLSLDSSKVCDTAAGAAGCCALAWQQLCARAQATIKRSAMQPYLMSSCRKVSWLRG